MNRKKTLWIFPLVIVVAVLLMAQDCEITLTIADINTEPLGTVVDVKEGEYLAGAEVTLTNVESGDTFTVESTATGFDFLGYATAIPPGDYTLTAELAGYAFAPKDVSINGLRQDLGEVIGFEYDPDLDANNLSFVLLWDGSFKDVDGYLTYPDQHAEEYAFTTPYDTPSTTNGFVPWPTATDRLSIYWDRLTSNGGEDGDGGGKGDEIPYDYDRDPDEPGNDSFRVELDVDNRGADDERPGGPETITVRTFPFVYSTDPFFDSTDGGGDTGLPEHTDANDQYIWVGAMEYYADAFSRTGAGTTTEDDLLSDVGETGANVELFVFSGDDVIGVYTIPDYTKVKTASLVRINMFYEWDHSESEESLYYQIVPDIRVFQGNNEIRAIEGSGATVFVYGGPSDRDLR